MNRIVAILITVLIGVAAGIQPAMNASLGKISGPKAATFLNFLLGGLMLMVFMLLTGGYRDIPLLAKAPWYLWLGSTLGLLIVGGTIYVVPVIGTAGTLSILVALQLLVAVIVDHFALFGAPRVPIDGLRIIGLVLLALGVQFIMR